MDLRITNLLKSIIVSPATALTWVAFLCACSGMGSGGSEVGTTQSVPAIGQDIVAPGVDPIEDKLVKRIQGSATIQCINSSQNTLIIHLSGKLQVKQENGTWTDCQSCKGRLLRIINDRDDEVDIYHDVILDDQSKISSIPFKTANYIPLAFHLMRKGFIPPEKVGINHFCDPYGCSTTSEDEPVASSIDLVENPQAPECPTFNGKPTQWDINL